MLKSPIRYPGGKSRVVKTLLEAMPKGIKSYCDPFVGGGSMLLAVRQTLPKVQCWAYDYDSELIDFWQAIKDYNEAERLK